MESTYSIDPARHLVRLKVTGELTADALIELLQRAGSDPQYVPGMSCLADCREAHGEWDYSEVQRLRDYLLQLAAGRDLRWAAVVSAGGLAAAGHLLMVMSEAVGATVRIQLFEDPQRALQWLEKGKVIEFLDGRVRVSTGDITLVEVDAIVNAANATLLGGGGVDGAIHRRGGPAILEACRELRRSQFPQGLPTGEAVVTTAGQLPARFVIHTVGPIWERDRNPHELLASCYRRSIQLAHAHQLRSIAFPAISTGIYGFPKDEAAAIASRAIAQALRSATSLQRVQLVFFSEADRDRFVAHQEFSAA